MEPVAQQDFGKEQGESVTQKDKSAPQLDAIFKLLTEEIKDRHEMEKLSGWTPWLLVGALISMSWILIQIIYKEKLNQTAITGSYLVTTLIIFTALDLRNSIGSKQSKTEKAIILLNDNITILDFLSRALWFGSASYASYLFSKTYSSIIFKILAGVYLFLGVFGLVFCVLTHLRIRIPTSKAPPKGAMAFTFLMIAIQVAGIISAVSSTDMQASDINSVQAGTIACLIVYVTIKLGSSEMNKTASKEDLIELRREIILGHSPIEDIYQRTRITLNGMFASDFMREDVRSLLKMISDVRAIHRESLEMISKIKSNIPALEIGAELSDFEKLAISNSLEILEKREATVSEISKEYFDQLAQIKKKFVILSHIANTKYTDEESVLLEIKEAQSRADKDLEKYKTEKLTLDPSSRIKPDNG